MNGPPKKEQTNRWFLGQKMKSEATSRFSSRGHGLEPTIGIANIGKLQEIRSLRKLFSQQQTLSRAKCRGVHVLVKREAFELFVSCHPPAESAVNRAGVCDHAEPKDW